MKTDTNDRLSIIIPPPVLFLRLWVSAFCWISCSNKAVPIDVVAPDYLQWDPILFAISGYLALGSMIVLLHNKTPFDLSKPTVKIVRQGPFRFSRNPMYLALLLLLAGIAAFTGSIWICLAVPHY